MVILNFVIKYNSFMERFENRWSNYVKFSTIFTLFLFIAVPYFIYFKLSNTNLPPFGFIKIVLLFYVILLFVAVVFFCWYFSVKEYIINEDGVTIVKPFSRLLIGWHEISDIIRISRDDLRSSIRLWGNGGVFGIYGFFKNKVLGKYQAYFADFDNLVLIRKRDGKNLVISPFNSDFFIEYAKKFLKK